MKLSWAGAGLAVVLGVSGAAAQDVPTWDGVYLGAFVGWEGRDGNAEVIGDSRYTLPDPGAGGAGNALTDSSVQGRFVNALRNLQHGGTAGGYAGYGLGLDRIFLGVEADLGSGFGNDSKGSASNSISGTYADTVAANDTTTASGTQTIGAENTSGLAGSVRARVGVMVTPSLLLYATGGAAVVNAERRATVSGVINFTDEAAATGTHTLSGAAKSSGWDAGWTAGSGVEAQLSESWSLRAEYRYSDYGSDSLTVPVNVAVSGTAPAASGSQSARVKFENAFHSVRVGLSYRF